MKTLKQVKTYALAAFAAVALLVSGCKKDQMISSNTATETTDASRDPNLLIPGGPGSIHMLMESTPAEGLGVVQVSISSVHVHYTDHRIGRNGWVLISKEATSYNLQQYHDGNTVNIGQNKRMPLGVIDQVRLNLGDYNYVIWADEQGRHFSKLTVTDHIGIAYTRAVINRMDSHLQMRINFSAATSVSNEGSGTYILDPIVTVTSIDQE